MIYAELPVPPGLNQTYKVSVKGGKGHFYKSQAAKQWRDDAVLLLRAAGCRTVPRGEPIGVSFRLHSMRYDLDAPIKTMLDAIAEALSTDDSAIAYLSGRQCRCKAEKLDICIFRDLNDVHEAPLASKE